MITRDQVVAVLLQLAEEHPRVTNPFRSVTPDEYKYMGEAKFRCYYNAPGNPDRHCIVGEIFSRFNLPVNDLGQQVCDVFSALNVLGRTDFEMEAIYLLTAAQDAADQGTMQPVTWAAAIHTLKENGDLPS